MKKNYFGIGVYHPKTTENIGTLWRSAHNFGADFIFTIGARYKRQASDTTASHRHVPLYHYKDWDDFISHLPIGSELVCVEQTNREYLLNNYVHPKSAVYVLGAEDEGIPPELMRSHQKVEIDTPHCLNVAVAGSVVLYDRQSKNAV